MDRSDRIKSFSVSKIYDKNLPQLKNSSLLPKPIVVLSKVDFDSRNINRQRSVRTISTLEKEAQRSKSGFTIRKNKETPTIDHKHHTKAKAEGLTVPSSLKQALREMREGKEEEQPISIISIDKAKVSSKSYGLVQAYSANSHPGPLLSYNEDRICIVTNLTKTNVRARQISFFGIYDGNNGLTKADYMRDHFHVCLA